MHREGPDSDAVNSALIYVDAMINYLMHQLDDNVSLRILGKVQTQMSNFILRL